MASHDIQLQRLARRIAKLEDARKRSKAPGLDRSTVGDGGIIIGDPNETSSKMIIRGDESGGVIEFYAADGEPGVLNPGDGEIEIVTSRTSSAVDADYDTGYFYLSGQTTPLDSPTVHLLSTGKRYASRVVTGPLDTDSGKRYEDGSVGGSVNVHGELRVSQRIFSAARDRHSRSIDSDQNFTTDSIWRTLDWTEIIEKTTEDEFEVIEYNTFSEEYNLFNNRCYLVTAMVLFSGAFTDGKRGVRIVANADSEDSFGGGVQASLFVDASSSGQTHLSVTALIDSLDRVHVECFQNSSGTVQILSGSRVNVRRLF